MVNDSVKFSGPSEDNAAENSPGEQIDSADEDLPHEDANGEYFWNNNWFRLICI